MRRPPDPAVPGGVRRREALVAAAAALVAAPGVAAAAPRRDDGDILRALVVREESASVATAHVAARVPGAPRYIERHEAEHALALRTLVDALGRHQPAPTETVADLAPGPARRLAESATLSAWIALEDSLIRDYRRALVDLREPSILRTAATILASHAQHRALLRA